MTSGFPTSSDTACCRIISFCPLQICQRDKFYDSYVEMPISCHSNFTHVAAATLVTSGRHLARRFNDSRLLVAAFHSHSSGVGTSGGSALCVFAMSDVRARAAVNVRRCYSDASVVVGSQFYRPGASSGLQPHYCTVSPVDGAHIHHAQPANIHHHHHHHHQHVACPVGRCRSYERPPCLLILCSMIGSCQTNVEWSDIRFNCPEPSLMRSA